MNPGSKAMRLGFALLAACLCVQAETGLAEPARVTVTRADCQRLVQHIPDAGVAYQPGVDVGGRPVAPADLGGGIDLGLPETYSFDVDIQPIAFAQRRQIAADRAALARDLADNELLGQGLADEAAALANREATIQGSFEAAAAAIIAATGGAGQTNAAVLANRTAQLEALRTNTLASPAYLDLQEDLARNRQARAVNEADAAALAEAAALLDAEAAGITARGLDATTMTVGRVTINVATGEASFNGRPLQNAEQAALAAKCRQVLQGQ